MPVYKMEGRKDGLQKYRVRINYVDKDGKGRQIDRVAYGKEAAKDLERKLVFETRTGDTETSGKMTVKELFDEYIAVKKSQVRETTLNKISKRLEHHVLPELSNVRLSALNPKKLQQWKLSIEQKETSKGEPFNITTKKGIYAEFRTMLNYAVKMEYIPKNPILTVGNFVDAYESRHNVDFYTPEEFKQFISASHDIAEANQKKTNSIYEWHFYVFFYIAFLAGLRKGEIFALKWSDIRNNRIYVSRSITQKLKGEDRETPPKTKASTRSVQMPSQLIKVIKEHEIRCKELDGYNSDWRICGCTECIRDTTVGKKNIEYSNAAGVKHIRIHDFRHSHASLLANNGINIQEIARRLGHSDVQTTWQVYAHLYPKEEERAVRVLNDIKF